MDRGLRAFFASLACVAALFPGAGCGLVLDASPPRDDAAVGAGIDAGRARDGGPLDAAMPDDATATDDTSNVTPLDGDLRDVRVPSDVLLDAGPPALPDAYVRSPCEGLATGEVCASDPRRICVDGLCVPSICGDGFSDVVAGEQCDPVSPTADPACVGCRYECIDDGACMTGTPCLAGSCSGHRCIFEVRNGACSVDATTAGLCHSGACVLSSCGDGVVDDSSEECDVGPVSRDGCTACQFDCDDAADCDDGDACNGTETCVEVVVAGEPAGRRCQPGIAAATCAPPTACHASMCVTGPAGDPDCQDTLLEMDGDGFAPGAGCGAFGGDCLDTDADIHPGAIEVCNGLDDDCDFTIDEDTATVMWCPDDDGDGFGDSSRGRVACAPPGGTYIRTCGDCFDTAEPGRRGEAALVHPGQPAFFTTPYVTGSGTSSFDYDCSGAAEQEVDHTVMCAALLDFECNSSSGWITRVPACGVDGTFAQCRGLGPLLCSPRTSDRRQACH